ncbi:hypothetical protein CDAR_424911 [Caerostris darwini]|uniref:Uncharacterized protein n=1 Tax=Caerostris darwini TaxID=1538125 RepID=A0AAV4PTJ8_9ARAC|nr:hypothetical protein CDAR_424911 [Caerostris darwini]
MCYNNEERKATSEIQKNTREYRSICISWSSLAAKQQGITKRWCQFDNFDLLADFGLLGEKYNELCVLNDEIMNLMLLETETNTADLDAETFAADEYNKKFKRINIIFKNKSNNREESDDCSSVQNISKRKFKLPLLELKKFGGEIKDWLPFWGQFSKIISDPNILTRSNT